VIAFAHHCQLEPIDELRAQCLSRRQAVDDYLKARVTSVLFAPERFIEYLL
jgi:hypothetical protein